ncbi:hypothetical protein SCACP_40280 [Sporomusa carbonis]|uniref:hypothetical protein n=1 Tax=Sporomusa carbonis TaxID=3076075 RepID=UPI003A631CF4
MRIAGIVLIIIFYMVSVCGAAANESEGFGGMVWGDSPVGKKNLRLLGYDMEAAFYEPIDKPKTVKIGSNSFRLKDIQYTFFDQEFARVLLIVDGTSHNAVVDELRKVYGPPAVRKLLVVTNYYWKGDKTLIELSVTPKVCTLQYTSKELLSRQLQKEGSTIDSY